MKNLCRKGHLKRSGKRWLALFMSVCLIGTMLPITARAETGGTEDTGYEQDATCTCSELCTEDHLNSDCPVCGKDGADLNQCKGRKQTESEEKQTKSEEEQTESEEEQTKSEEEQTESEEEQTESEEKQTESEEEQTESEEEQAESEENDEVKDETAITITAWQWIDEEEYLDPETGNLALPGADKDNPVSFDDITALLPTKINATVEDAEDTEAESAEETITLGDWNCEDYPEKGAYTGSYTFTATLPEGYALSKEAEALEVLVELGGAEMYDNEGSVGAFTVEGGTLDEDYTYADGVLTIKTATAITIANIAPATATTDRIEVAKDVSANITLAGVNIDVSSSNYTAAFKIADNSRGNVTITLADDSNNKLKSGFSCAGLQKNGSQGKLIIQGGTNGTGMLTAIGSSNGAGIGGGQGKNGSNITISGGTVTATSDSRGAGIGGGQGNTGSNITISGGTVTATGGGSGAGIGGGWGGTGSNITISGGIIIANSSFGGAGIGGGYNGAGSNITISGGTVTAAGGGSGAGIGGGSNGTGSDIEISGGTVTATGGYGGAGIGGGCFGGSGSNITINGGTVTATGGYHGAGIGGGSNGTGSDITISGGTVTATGGEGGAGIGGSSGSGSEIKISGGIITATGGKYGAGIGGGNSGTGSNITISGGTVTATGGENGAGIGGGAGGSGSDITMNGDVVLYVSSFDSIPTFTKGVVYQGVITVSVDSDSYSLTGGVGTVYGNPDVSGFTKPVGSKLGTDFADTQYITVTVPDVDYTGAEAAPAPTVTVNKTALSKTLVQGTDYTVSVSDSDKINAGAKTAAITAVEGSGNVNETTKAFNVNTVDLSVDKIEMSLSGIPDGGYVYDSTAKEPVPVVTLKQADGSEYTLIKDTDYTVGYSNNKDAYELLTGDDGYESDKAPTVTVTAKDGGNFTGSRSMNFTIQPAPMSDIAPDIAVTPYSGSYDGVSHPVVGTDGITGLVGEDNKIYYSTDSKATWSTTVPTITNAGTFHFYVKVTKPNYKDWISEKLTAEVSRKPVTVTAEDKTKTYGEDNPELTFTVPARALSGTDTKDDLGVTLSCEATKASPVKEGGYAIIGTSDSANYEVTVIPGTLTIEKANAEIIVGTATYNKTFGDAAFILSDVTGTNSEANVQYRVTGSKDAAGKDVANDAVVTVDENGTVTIHGAGTATITLSLPESTNYHAAEDKTVAIHVAKKSGVTVPDIDRDYWYSSDWEDSIDLKALLPADCGNTVYGAPQTDGAVAYAVSPAVTDGILSYTVRQGAAGTAGSIRVTATTDNYEDMTITVNLTLSEIVKLRVVRATAATREYDGTDQVQITDVAIERVESGDEVAVDTAKLTGTIAGKNAGTYDAVTLPALTLTGADAGKYTLVQPEAPVPADVTIEKAAAVITIESGKESYTKNVDDAPFRLEGITGNSEEAKVQYRVTDSKDEAGKTVADDAVVTVDENGTVTIHGAGTATIILSLPESTNYKAAEERTVSIRVTDMPDGLWMEEISDQTYNGKAIKPEVEVYYDRQLLTAGKDYTVSYRNNTNAAAADAVNAKGKSIAPTVTIKGKGNFSGTVTKTFTVKPIDLDNYKTDAQLQEILTIEPVCAKYTGKVIKTAPTVKLNGKKLALSAKQYTCEYNDEALSAEQTAYKDCGTYTITIVGSGRNFVGTTTVTETISEKLITRTKLTTRMITQTSKSFPYDGTKHSVVKGTDYTITDGATALVEGRDYTVTYTGDRTHAGTFKVNFNGIGAYSGTVTKSFTIRKASVQALDVTLPDSDSVVYTKSGVSPKPQVRFNGALLTEGTDYTVTYKNNTKVASAGDSKAPYLYITGKGNFTGNTKDKPVKFTIVAAPLDAQTIVVDNVPYKNKNNNFVPAVTITDSTTGKKLAKKTDYLGSFTYEIWDTDAHAFVSFNGKKVEASEDNIRMRITVTGAGNYTGQAVAEYEICPKSITSVKVAKIPNQEYTGQAITPKLTITDNGKELTEGTDYTLEYSNNTKKGTASVTVRGKGQYGGSKTVKFKITFRIFKWF